MALADLRAVYQPIVDLETGGIVAVEALARPADVLDGAISADLDWACRATALEGALRGGLPPSLWLFVNVEPSALGTPCPPELVPLFRRAAQELRVVLEVTERNLTVDPAALLGAVEQARSWGWGIALDDVGADPASLALMPFISPDVVKLDLSLVQGLRPADTAAICHAVLAETERTGAAVLAEGIETDDQLRTARALGATLGQGWLLGRPGPLPIGLTGDGRLPLVAAVDMRPSATPFEVVTAARPPRVAARALLAPMRDQLERQAADRRLPPVVVSCGDGRLRLRCAGHQRDVVVADDDRLRPERDLVVVGPHFAAALVARDHGADCALALTHDRDLVLAAARSLLGRVMPSRRE